jgi:hypothetical protein
MATFTNPPRPAAGSALTLRTCTCSSSPTRTWPHAHPSTPSPSSLRPCSWQVLGTAVVHHGEPPPRLRTPTLCTSQPSRPGPPHTPAPAAWRRPVAPPPGSPRSPLLPRRTSPGRKTLLHMHALLWVCAKCKRSTYTTHVWLMRQPSTPHAPTLAPPRSARCCCSPSWCTSLATASRRAASAAPPTASCCGRSAASPSSTTTPARGVGAREREGALARVFRAAALD